MPINLQTFFDNILRPDSDEYIESIFATKRETEDKIRIIKFLRAKSILSEIVCDLELSHITISFMIKTYESNISNLHFVDLSEHTKDFNVDVLLSNLELIFSELDVINRIDLVEVFGHNYLFKMKCNNLDKLNDFYLTTEESIALNMAMLDWNLPKHNKQNSNLIKL